RSIRNVLTLSSGKELPGTSFLNLAVGRALGSSLKPSTRSNYGYALGTFLRFCFELGLSTIDIFPLSEGLLLAFVSTQAGSKAKGTVSNYFSALSAWHDIWGVEWKRFPLVDRALQGIARLAPDKLPLRPPVRLSDLAAARSMLDIDSNPLDAAVWACALVTFWAACRLGETTCPSQNFFNPARHVTRSAVSAMSLLPDDALALSFHLPWTKTTKRAGMTKVFSSQPDLLDPISALHHHLSFNTTPSTDNSSTSIFAYRVKAGRGWRLVPLSKDKMLDVFGHALARAGLPSLPGHSFRIGAATFYWHHGATVEEIKLLGGWDSDLFKIYLRDPVLGLAPLQQRLGAS
ncbi:hypothetical protein CF328_g9528, partial [Tilletia controversa]